MSRITLGRWGPVCPRCRSIPYLFIMRRRISGFRHVVAVTGIICVEAVPRISPTLGIWLKPARVRVIRALVSLLALEPLVTTIVDLSGHFGNWFGEVGCERSSDGQSCTSSVGDILYQCGPIRLLHKGRRCSAPLLSRLSPRRVIHHLRVGRQRKSWSGRGRGFTVLGYHVHSERCCSILECAIYCPQYAHVHRNVIGERNR